MSAARIACVLLAGLMLGGCTTRYSQVMVGRVIPAPSKPLSNNAEGFDLGFGSPIGITFTEPASAVELAPSCEVALAAVDYRSRFFIIPLFVNPTVIFPEVTVTAACVQ